MRFQTPAPAVLAGAAALLAAACSDPTASPKPLAASTSARRVVDAVPVALDQQTTQQYIVTFKPGANDLADATAVNAAGVVKRGHLVYSNAAVFDNVTDPAVLAADPNVAEVHENLLYYPTQTGYQTRALYWQRGWQWNMKQVRADSTPSTARGAGAKVCIIDSGIDKTHQDLAGKVVAEASFVDVAHGYPGPGLSAAMADSNGHGSHVASTVTSNGIGVASVAPAAQLMTAKVFAATGGATTAAIYDAIDYCTANGADVINMSLGGTRARPLTASGLADSVGYATHIAAARQAGVVVVVAAGNDNAQLDASNAALSYSFPAQIPGTVTVGASAPVATKPGGGAYYSYPFNPAAPNAGFDGKASYSNYGADVDVWAPGGTGYINAAQANITAACSSFRSGCVGGRTYMGDQGTSMASPHVAGLAALITSRATTPRGFARTQAVENCIYSTGDQVSFAGANATTTRPRINALRATTASCAGL